MHDLNGYVVFCEDIRLEHNSQVSYIGVYPKNVASFDPDEDGEIVLAKFAAACYITIPTSAAGKRPTIEISIVKGDGEEEQVSVDQLPQVPERSVSHVNGVKFIQFEGVVVLPGDQINVTLSLEGDHFCLGRFRIRARKESMSEDSAASAESSEST